MPFFAFSASIFFALSILSLTPFSLAPLIKVNVAAAQPVAEPSLPLTTTDDGVWLIYSNDVQGELEPCGCRNSPAGGIDRKKTLLDLLKANALLQVDAGDFLFDSKVIAPALRETALLKATTQIKAHNLLKHDVTVPGEKDFALGMKAFESLQKLSNFPFIAANLKGFKPYLILKKKNYRIAILGLVDPSLGFPSELKASSALIAAKKWIPVLSKKSDILIVLSHQGLEQDLELLAQLKGDADKVTYLIGAHSQSFLQTPRKVGKTTVLQSSFKNQYVGILSLEHPEQNALVALDPGFQNDNALTKLIQEWKSKTAALSEKEVLKLKREQTSLQGSGTPEYQTFPKCAECHLKQFDFWRKTQHASSLKTLITAHQEKNKDCLQCHTLGLGQKGAFENPLVVARFKELESIDSTTDQPLLIPAEDLDAVAWEKLLAEMRDKTSFTDEIKLKRAPGERTTLKGALNLVEAAWAPVQCESCHQAGQNHPFSGEYTKTVPESRCLNCHTPDRAPGWYLKSQAGKSAVNPEILQRKRKLVICPAGELE